MYAYPYGAGGPRGMYPPYYGGGYDMHYGMMHPYQAPPTMP